MIGAVITGIISFFSTNIDDIFVLMIFFAQTESLRGKFNVVAGQYLGIASLVVISIFGAFLLKFLPEDCIRFLGFVPMVLGVKAGIEYYREKKGIGEDQNEGDAQASEETVQGRGTSRGRASELSILSVALVTIANGGDNIGVYVPLFAGYDAARRAAVAAVFAVMTGLWCFSAMKLASLPAVGDTIRKYKGIIVPVVFVTLGFYILLG